MVDEELKIILKPELVPRPLIGRSVFKALARGKEWISIRESAIESARGACEICGSKNDKGMICHEVWDYDDTKHLATLIKFQLICPYCNFVVHVGGSGNVWGGNLSMDIYSDPTSIALEHIIEVNGISLDNAIQLLADANKLHDERSKFDWEITIAYDLKVKFPVLDGLTL